MRQIRFAKGHGTENDFVLVLDPDGDLDLDPATVARLCDRRAGLGGDGLIRVVRSDALADGAAHSGEATWFMDYSNSDGSPAEMCGNGIRVFVHYLVHEHLVDLADGESLRVGTRAGVKTVRRDGDGYAADLGAWRVVGGADAAAAGSDARVTFRAGDRALALPGLGIDVGNPHVVVALPGADLLAAADLTTGPTVDPVPVNGINVELVVPRHDRVAGAGHLTMRVHERGSGETRSCGTGAAAAALAARVWGGPQAPDVWTVDVPGGRLRVSAPEGTSLDGPAVELAGPAVLVAHGVLDPAVLAGAPLPV